MKDATITVRVSEQLKKDIRRYRVNLSEVVRESLKEEIKRRRLQDLKKAAGELGELFAKIPEERIVEDIRETRRSR